jgi:ubiquitin carboxyl-terminal hydrolase 7
VRQATAEQHDAHEFCVLFTTTLNEKVKGGVFGDVFKGETKKVIKCREVEYTSEGVEEVWELTLDVEGVTTVVQAIDRFFTAEVLEGDNAYHAEGFGKQVIIAGFQSSGALGCFGILRVGGSDFGHTLCR